MQGGHEPRPTPLCPGRLGSGWKAAGRGDGCVDGVDLCGGRRGGVGRGTPGVLRCPTEAAGRGGSRCCG